MLVPFDPVGLDWPIGCYDLFTVSISSVSGFLKKNNVVMVWLLG